MKLLYNRVAKLMGLALLAVMGIGKKAIAQTPVITPNANIILKLDKSGYRVNLPAEIATVLNPDGSKPSAVYVNPTSFDCSKYGPQTVTVTAINYNPLTNTYVHRVGAPNDLSFDASGKLYIAHASFSIDQSYNGFFIRYIGGNKGYNDGVGIQAAFEFITGICSDPAGNIYVVDLNHIVRKIGNGLSGTSARIAGNGLAAYADGKYDQASFKLMTDIAVDSKGNIFVLDDGNALIRKITPDSVVTTFAGQLNIRSYTDGNGINATFTKLNGIYLDKADNMYIADGNKIRKVTPDGDVTTIAGSGIAGYADGPAATAKFNEVKRLVMDSGGNLFVTDYNNNRIRKISTNGMVTTFAGDGLPHFKDGVGTDAGFDGPYGLAMDAVGNLYTGDFDGNRIRKIYPDGTVVNYIGNGTWERDAGIIGGTIKGQASKTINVTVQADLEFAEHPDVVVKPNANCLPLLPDYTREGKVTTCPFANVTITQFPAPGTLMTVNTPVTVTLTATDPYGTTATTSFKATYKYMPVITPLSTTPVITLNASGSYVLKPSDLANIVTCNGTTPEIRIEPASLDCSNLGPQTVRLTAINQGALTPANARFREPEGLTFDAAGNMYVADAGNYLIRKISRNGDVTTLAGGTRGKNNGVGAAAQFNYPVGVAVDANGNVFVSDMINGLIRKITPDGTVSTFAGGGNSLDGTGTAASFSLPTELEFDTNGDLFVLDHGTSLIRKITPSGVVTTIAGQTLVSANYDGVGRAAAFVGLDGLTITKRNEFYLADQNAVRKMTPGAVVTTLAGNPTEGYNDGSGPAARFNLAMDVVTDASGNVYVTDFQNNRIRKITPDGTVSTFAGSGAAGAVDGAGTVASFNGPRGLAIDGEGNVYVSEIKNHDIRKITPTGFVSTYAGQTVSGSNDGNIGDESNATDTKEISIIVNTMPQFAPEADKLVAADANGNAAVPDYTKGANVSAACGAANLTVTQIPAAGTPLTLNTPTAVTLTAKDQFGGQSTVSFNVTAKSTPVITPLAQPVTVKLGAGGVYTPQLNDLATVTMSDNSTPVVSISPATLDCSKLGLQMLTITAKNAAAMQNTSGASFNTPLDIITDAAGNSYIADDQNNKIRKMTPDGTVSTVAGTGTAGYDNGAAETSAFRNPHGLAFDAAGNIYVADFGNNRIRKIGKNGVVSTIAGSGKAASSDGIGTSADINGPYKMLFDKSGNLYIVEYGGGRIRKMLPSGVMTTVTGAAGAGGTDGPGYQATFNGIAGMCIDAADNIYVTDNGSRVRKITPIGDVSTIAGTAMAGFKDGAAATAQFNGAAGIAIDGAGNLYVADKGNSAIRKIAPDGTVSTLLKGTALNQPAALSITSTGDILVADAGYQSIIKIAVDGSVTKVAGTGQAGAADGRAGLQDITVSKQVVVNVEGSVSFTSVFNDVILPVSATCPTTMPDYAAKATGIACSGKLTFTQSPAAGTAITGAAPITVTITADNGLGGKATTSFKVTPDTTPQAAPSASVTASAQTFCEGTTVNFKVTTANVPGVPVYKWLVNGQQVGTDHDTYSSSTLKDNDVVKCDIQITAGCIASVSSNSFIAKVNANMKPGISISANSLNVCAGTAITFTATPQNGGTAPTYQWMVNGLSAGTNSNSFTIATPANGDKVSCTITNNDAGCFTSKTATSTELTINVSPMVTPTVSISPSTGNPVCPGTRIDFTATTNVGNPTYQWQVNGNNAGTNSNKFSTTTLANGDKVTCSVTTSTNCSTLNTALSNEIAVAVKDGVILVPVVSTISTDICSGQTATFNVNIGQSNAAVSYSWEINGTSAGGNFNTFTSAALKDGDVVSCSVTANDACSVPFKSNNVTIHVPTVSFNVAPAAIKKGQSVTLSPTIKGNIVSYRWSPSAGLSNPDIADPVASPEVTTTYQLTYTSATGCQTTVSVTVTVISSIEISNSFTPNGDGINDTWKIAALAAYPNNTVDVFDRTGNLIFHSNGYAAAWDGTFKGAKLPPGTYFYIVDTKGGVKPISGSVTIIR